MFEGAEMLRHLEDAGLQAPYLERLAAYGAVLLQANRTFNLTGAKTTAELARHLIDSLSVAPFVSGRLVDIGSGGGLPAIPLAIATGVEVTMVESTVKKAVFLASALAELGLAGRVISKRAELAAHNPELRERFDCGTARAVSTASTVAELLLPFLRVGGTAILQRGALEEPERHALADAALMLGGRLEDERPLNGGRRILVVRKVGATPQKFPRRAGIPEKRPLCSP
ncbi:MAG: 16S rRNA (guanine(527)-N(7))-methyltransferase RsmG [Candidatus Eremiobacteraeota bacterium]|nr:16S rRNA (guanine(527)-N(7))-methyltransferase RsmG [Candidatus Eremiobacteraeota bacterium]